MIIPTKKEASLIFYGGELAIIKIDRNRSELEKIIAIKKWFITEYGIYEKTKETDYVYNKQLLSFYYANGDTLPKDAVKKIYKLYENCRDDELLAYLKELYKDITNPTTIYEMFAAIAKAKNHYAIDIDGDKFMPSMRAYTPKSIVELILQGHKGTNKVETLGPILPKGVIPVVYILAGVITLAILAQNIPGWIREAVEYMENSNLFKLTAFLNYLN